MDNSGISFFVRVAGESQTLNKDEWPQDGLPEAIRRVQVQDVRDRLCRAVNMWQQPFFPPTQILKVAASTETCMTVGDLIFGASQPAMLDNDNMFLKPARALSAPSSGRTFPFPIHVSGTGIVPVRHQRAAGIAGFLGEASQTRQDVTTMLAEIKVEGRDANCRVTTFILPPEEFTESLLQLTNKNDTRPLTNISWGSLSLCSFQKGQIKIMYTTPEEASTRRIAGMRHRSIAGQGKRNAGKATVATATGSLRLQNPRDEAGEHPVPHLV